MYRSSGFSLFEGGASSIERGDTDRISGDGFELLAWRLRRKGLEMHGNLKLHFYIPVGLGGLLDPGTRTILRPVCGDVRAPEACKPIL